MLDPVATLQDDTFVSFSFLHDPQDKQEERHQSHRQYDGASNKGVVYLVVYHECVEVQFAVCRGDAVYDECVLIDTRGGNFERDVPCVVGGEAVPVRHIIEHFFGGVQNEVDLLVAVYLENGLVEKGNVASAEDAWNGGVRDGTVKKVFLLEESLERGQHIGRKPCRKEHQQQRKIQKGRFSRSKESHEFLIAWI